MTDLNSLAELSAIYPIRNAIGINNNGQILVVTAIPEPQSYALMLAGLGLIGCGMAPEIRKQNLVAISCSRIFLA
jgi:hypothetical protein